MMEIQEIEVCGGCDQYRHRHHYVSHVKSQEQLLVERAERHRKTILRQEARKQERIQKWDNLRAQPCSECNQKFPVYCIEAHHRDGTEKITEVSQMVRAKCHWEKVEQELAKCDLLCSNCHRLKTYRGGGKLEKISRLARQQVKIVTILKGITPCFYCGQTFQACQMDFDHIEKDSKEGKILSFFGKPMSLLLAEIVKCQLVCSNCHRIRHHTNAPCAPPEYSEMLVRKFKELVLIVPLADNKCLKSFPWEHLVGTMPDEVLAKQVGVPEYTVNQRRRKLKVSAFKRAPKDYSHPWDYLLGTMPDADIAKLVNYNVGTVQQYRNRLGIPAYRKIINSQPKSWYSLLGTMPDTLIAKQVGVPYDTISRTRKKLGIPAFDINPNKISGCALEEDHRVRVYPWGHLVGTMPDKTLASQVGVTRMFVRQMRRKLGLVAIKTNRSGMKSKPWHAFLGAVPDIELAKKYGLNSSTVRHMRRTLGIPSYRTTLKAKAA